MTHINTHLATTLIDFHDFLHVLDLKLGIDSLRKHIVSHRQNIHITGTFSIAQKSAFHTVCTGEKRQFCDGHTGSSVIMGMYAEDDIVPILKMGTHPLNLICIDIGCIHFHRGRQIKDNRCIGSMIPFLLHRRTDTKREIHLCAGKTLRRIL